MKHFLFWVCICWSSCSAKAGTGWVYLADSTRLFFAINNELYAPDQSTLLYFSKGNIFFKGTRDDKQNIYLLTSSMNPASASLQTFYLGDNKEEVFSFQENQFYYGKNETSDFMERNKLVHFRKSGKWTAAYSSLSDSLLAYYLTDSLPPSIAIIVAYTLIKKYGLPGSLNKLQTLPAVNTEHQFSTIKPIWGNVIDNEWIWDGEILRLRWSNDPRFFWTFDGQYIKPYYLQNINLQYEWDGELFKPIWRNSRAEEWIYDGRLLKPVYDTDWANQYVLENNVLKPWSNVHSEREWRVDGTIPTPLLILVVSGIAGAR
ncbi:MAG: hypothetical protein IPH78_10790 [Bacteroidetes bacterium]|nr:hypothetical protein [Bacteroidota bacterium]